jgi:uncharacterized DUF497 family protein
MPFEYNPDKNAANKAKHKLDFEEAQALWNDANRIEFDARTKDEPRRITIGKIAGKLWAAIFTMRGESIRLISMRRARDEEVEWYENDQGE